ncbi:MAG: monovalent cation/H+ antiporter complex subunit F [Wenzhouxiangellaceae bacterium]|nr:pH regulation protein F [Wenzhouxiangellaceae bacterium]MBS3745992.1 pH regulation protein F [Wenzhouxiangellaceae bacterium]MBS3822354.1 pH regulation protein F [Wenzhouxiangellaceae bacterium]
MTTVLVLTALAIFVTMALALVRALKGPSVYDRIVAVNVIGTKTVLVVALITAISGNDDLIDVALVYALINFIAVVTVLKLSRMRDLAAAGEGDITDG